MLKLLESSHASARISEYESGIREPNLIMLLRYARLVGVGVDVLIDDDLKLPKTLKPKKKRGHLPH